jgi:hypothetical protein
MRRIVSFMIAVLVLGGSVVFSAGLQAETQQQKQAPAQRPVVARPQIVRPTNAPANTAVRPGVVAKGQAGPNVNGATAHGAATVDPRAQLMDMVRPAFPNPAASPTATVPRPTATAMHTPLARDSFVRPANVPHNPAHRLGSVGSSHGHAAFMFARGGHRFYRRYYVLHGIWYWYDDTIPVGDPGYADVGGLPNCDLNADECQGEVVPLAAPLPAAAFAPTDTPDQQ